MRQLYSCPGYGIMLLAFPTVVFRHTLTFLPYKDIEFRIKRLSHKITNIVSDFKIEPRTPHAKYMIKFRPSVPVMMFFMPMPSASSTSFIYLYYYAYDGEVNLAIVQDGVIQAVTPFGKFVVSLFDVTMRSTESLMFDYRKRIIKYDNEEIEMNRSAWNFIQRQYANIYNDGLKDTRLLPHEYMIFNMIENNEKWSEFPDIMKNELSIPMRIIREVNDSSFNAIDRVVCAVKRAQDIIEIYVYQTMNDEIVYNVKLDFDAECTDMKIVYEYFMNYVKLETDDNY